MIKNDVECKLAERFALQHDRLPDPDLEDVRRRAQRLRTGAAIRPPKRMFAWRVPMRTSVVAATAAVVVAAGTATAFAVRALTRAPVTEDFSALSDSTLPLISPTTPGIAPQVGQFFREQLGSDYTARQVGDGMFLAQQGADLCEAVTNGAAGCTDHLDGSVWLFGDQVRAYDAETAPFDVHFYGFARDSVTAVRVTTSEGDVISLPVVHNAFQTTFADMTFDDISAIDVVSTSGQTTSLNPRLYFPPGTGYLVKP